MKRHLLLAIFTFIAFATPSTAFGFAFYDTCGPRWANSSVDYWINSQGSSDIAFSTVESIMQDSFAEWGTPCCSEFSASYQGTTSLTAANNQGRIVLSFYENSWNPQWGSVNQTIGVTFVSWSSQCRMIGAPIAFNGVGFRFTDGGGGTDLQSIATHEIGHLAGLGHSNAQDATMFASYGGGTATRSLAQDDVNGICTLYTGSCACSSNAQCNFGLVCINNRCSPPPCQSDADCGFSLTCAANGDCVPPQCTTDTDCEFGFNCDNNICVTDCPSCRRHCDENSRPCDPGSFCLNFGETSACIEQCDATNNCPGDSVCYAVGDGQGGQLNLCGGPNVTTTLCDNYYCRYEDACETNAECGAQEVCTDTANGRRCVVDRCVDVTCGPGLVCSEGLCIRDETSNNNPGNNNPGNNTPGTTGGNNSTTGTGGNTGGGGGGGNGGTDPVIIIVSPQDTSDDTGCACATSSPQPSGSLLILLGGLLFSRRRRR